MNTLTKLILFVAIAATVAYGQEPRNRGAQNAPGNGAGQAQAGNAGATDDVHLLRIRGGNIRMLVGAGGNITVQAGEQGIFLVDTGLASMSGKVMAAIRPLSPKPVMYIVNTDDRADHVGGNLAIATGGGGGRGRGPMVNIISFLTVLDRMTGPSGKPSPYPEAAWPNDTYSGSQRNLHFNGEGIQIFHQPGTTDGNSIVLFRGSDVVSAGDIFDPTQYPIIDLNSGGSLQGVLEGLNRLRGMVVPELHYEGGTMVIPGHGRLCDSADLAVYQQMVTIIRDRIQSMIKNGMTLDQVKAAKITQDFDPIYGSTTGNWTTDMFVEAAYKSLSGKQDTTTRSAGKGELIRRQ